jgi:hypothetical protein
VGLSWVGEVLAGGDVDALLGGLEWLGAAAFVYGPAATGNNQQSGRRSWSGSVKLARARPKAVWQVLWRDRGTPLAAPMPALSANRLRTVNTTHTHPLQLPATSLPVSHPSTNHSLHTHTHFRSHGPDQEGESARYPAGPFLLAACTPGHAS